MPFNPLPKKEFKEFKKTQWMDLKPGKHIIRVLGDPYVTYVHNIRKGYIKCWEQDCPVCQQNKKIISAKPDSFRNSPDYSGRTQRMYVNVLDLTPVKVCPNPECNTAVKKDGRSFPDACPECHTLGLKQVPITPLNKVVVLNMGKKLYDQFVGLEDAVKDADGEKLGTTNFDIVLSVVGVGTERTMTADETDPLVRDIYEIPEDSTFELEKCLLTIPPEKINDYRRGVSLKDIFNSLRKPGEDSEDVSEEAEKLSDEMASLFVPKE